MKLARRISVKAVLTFAAVAASPVAVAQSSASMGASGPATITDEGIYSGAKARLVMEGFARCVMARHRAAVVRAIALPPMSVDETKALAKLVDDDCLRNGQMNFSSAHFRGALYTALYRERFDARMGIVRTDPVDFAAGATSEPGSQTAHAVAMRQFVDCAVRKRPDAAHRVIVGKAGSNEENAGFSALFTDLTACVAKDAQIRFRRGELEGLIAEVMYLDTAEPAPQGTDK